MKLSHKSWLNNSLDINTLISSEAIAQKCSAKKVLLKISQNSQESTCDSVPFLINLQASGQQLYLKRDSHTRVFCLIFCCLILSLLIV